jgi:hypothetical protein
VLARAACVTAAVALLLTAPAPATAKRASPFVPAGYRVEHRLSLQLDADGRPDRALVLRREGKIGAGTPDRPSAATRSLDHAFVDRDVRLEAVTGLAKPASLPRSCAIIAGEALTP